MQCQLVGVNSFLLPNNLFYYIYLLGWLSSCRLIFLIPIFINISGNLNHKNMTNYLTNEVKIAIFTIFNNIFCHFYFTRKLKNIKVK